MSSASRWIELDNVVESGPIKSLLLARTLCRKRVLAVQAGSSPPRQAGEAGTIVLLAAIVEYGLCTVKETSR